MNARERAQRLARHYFLVVHRDTKPSLIDTDCEAEVDELVDAIIEAAADRAVEILARSDAEAEAKLEAADAVAHMRGSDS